MKTKPATTVLAILFTCVAAQGTEPQRAYTKEERESIYALHSALVKHWETFGAFPSTQDGLGGLTKEGEPKSMKQWSLQMDPWGRPCSYSATRNTMTLISKGLDTENAADDITVAEAMATDGKVAPEFEQAKPVIALLRSVKESNLAAFQQCWTKEAAGQLGIDADSAKRMFQEYRQGFAAVFGDYQMEDFSFGFVGVAKSGEVRVMFKTKKDLPAIKVVKSGNDWTLLER